MQHSSPAPLIGVIADHRSVDTGEPTMTGRFFVGVYETYLRALTAAGALPVIVPIEPPPADLRGIFDRLDGVLLTGGGDIEPVEYNDTPINDTLSGVKPVRDKAELLFSQWAVEADKPIIGICRGIQVLNVALGGNLYQDIPAQFETDVLHDSYGIHPMDHYTHTVNIEPGSRLAAIVGKTEMPTNSRHHQSLKDLGEGLVVTATTPDSIIEAVERPQSQYCLAVQWHPESFSVKDPAMHALFTSFVEAAGQYHQKRHNGSRA